MAGQGLDTPARGSVAAPGSAAAHWVRADLILLSKTLFDEAQHRTPPTSTQLDPTSPEPTPQTSTGPWHLWSAPNAGIQFNHHQCVIPSDTTGYRLQPLADIPADVTAQFPALTGFQPMTFASGEAAMTSQTVDSVITGQLVVGLENGPATAVQIPGVLDDVYAPQARQRTFGPVLDAQGAATLAVWAPTAQCVTVLAWPEHESLSNEPLRIPTKREQDGSWVTEAIGNAADLRYQYEVQVYAPSTRRIETNIVLDPYGTGLNTYATHSIVVDMTSPPWTPDSWRTTVTPEPIRAVDQMVYELHVRDFSRDDATVPAEKRGTYLAFGEDTSRGTSHLRALSEAGVTSVHLLPTYSIASIPSRGEQSEPPELQSLPADSPHQQARIHAVRAFDAFNWGYDPLQWFVPEGSYTTNAEGGPRTAQFRTMVAALHGMGLRVILDQVFNHTSASGQDPRSVLDRIVPGYYHRQCRDSAAVFDSTCCANTATEHVMAGKMMVDCVVHWVKNYHVDGFRFDLMGHHTKQNMLDVRAALNILTVDNDGVDGTRVYLYGEGWNFGEVAGNALFEQATQGNLGGTEIATFSDRLRDAVLGGNPTDGHSVFQQGYGTGLATTPNWRPVVEGVPWSPVHDGGWDDHHNLAELTDVVMLGLAGNLRDFPVPCTDRVTRPGRDVRQAGYADEPSDVMSYVDAHDNETLFDQGILKLPVDTTMEDRVRINTLMLALVALAQTPGFWHAGTELLRSKSLDRNSFDSGDWFNFLDFSQQDNGFGRGLPPSTENSARWQYQRELLANPTLKPAPEDIAAAYQQALDVLRLRSSLPQLRLGSSTAIRERVTFPVAGPGATPGVITMLIEGTPAVLMVVNASPWPVTQTVPSLSARVFGLSAVQVHGYDDIVRQTTWSAHGGTARVPARTVAVLVEREPH
ncbi:MAG: pullulanase-type alpha-1,6-glucosidase [Cellulomonadaceae bacterium]|jgi:pullulanase-type alpha-1,6-glucosidase|nr:pullulanase-type alpha-1,6-glucosidase [Cellulomonadaceae bacterium]